MILSNVEVEDFDRFWSTFSSKGLAKRKEHGSRGVTVFRNREDGNRVHTLFDWDPEDFEGFMADPEVPGIFQEAGLKAPPTPIYVEKVEDLEA